MAPVLVIAVRLVVPLSILRWPLGGAIAAMVVDALDVVLVDTFASLLGEPREFGPIYAELDKWLDLYYLTIEAYVASRWREPLLRDAALLLFAWRVIGVVVFSLTAFEGALLVFPNLFENLYLYVVAVRRFVPRLLPRTAAQLLVLLLILWIPKILQEWVLHIEEAHPWQWLRSTFIDPLLGT